MKKLKETSIPSKVEIGVGLIVYILLLMLLAFGLTSCSNECETQNTYTYFEPVYTSVEELRSSVALTEPRAIESMGKLYFKDGFLYVNEPNQGVHVIDNRDPSNPISKAFITIPGAFDLAINGNILYSDSYIDLVAIDISDPNTAKEVGRLEGAFVGYNSYGFYVDPELGLVTDWVETSEVSVTKSSCEGQEYGWGIYYANGIALNESASFDATSAVSPSNPGIGGSMARFTLTNNHLFVLDGSEMFPVQIADPGSMEIGERLFLDWGIETIFPRNETIFVGATNGMYIVDVENPLSPSLTSVYSHINSCDPVIVQGDFAYVTLRSGTTCNGFTNQLEIVDISNLEEPQLVATHQMTKPHGLGIDDDLLFICDGEAGLRVFDASDHSAISRNELVHYSDIFAYDIIPFNNVAMLLAEDGLYQYDYSNVEDIRFLSKIDFKNAD